MNRLRFLIRSVPLIIILASCAYFNTVYNAKNYFREGRKLVTHDTLKVDSEFFDKTIEKATLVIVKHSNSGWVDDALFMMGASYYYKGDYPRALEKLDFLLLNYPESKFYDDALYYKGLAYYKQQKFAASIIALKEAMEFKKFKSKAMIALSYAYHSDQNYTSLTEVTQELLKESLGNNEKRDVYRLLGEAQFNQQLYTAALETYTRLLAITRGEEDKRILKLKVAEIYLEISEYDLCKEFLAGEDDPEFKNILADLNVRIGEIEQAKEIYLEVVTERLTDFASEAYYKLAELYENEGSLDSAIAYYDSSIAMSSLSEYGKRAQKRADVLKRIVSLTNETENIDHAQFHLAEVYFVDLDEPDKAIEVYQKVYEGYPESIWAPKALYAHFWIVKNVLHNDSIAYLLTQDLLNKYPNSDFAKEIKKTLEKEIPPEMNEDVQSESIME